MEASHYTRVFKTQHTLKERQGTLIEGFCLLRPPLRLVELCQVVKCYSSIRMLRTQCLLIDSEGPLL
jgi:hypothetical protein